VFTYAQGVGEAEMGIAEPVVSQEKAAQSQIPLALNSDEDFS